MPVLKDKKSVASSHSAAIAYRGRQTKTGNSSGFRFEGALFKSHPEFNGEVKAQIIAPGRMLVTVESFRQERADPVMESFLAFLAQDMVKNPSRIRPLSAARMKRIDRLTKGVEVDPDEDLGDESYL